MPKGCVRLVILLLVQLAAGSAASAQSADSQARESEWKSYKLPADEFSRSISANRIVLFHARSEQAPTESQKKEPGKQD